MPRVVPSIFWAAVLAAGLGLAQTDAASAARRADTDESTRAALADLLTQLEALQAEVRQLRGQLEVQTHEIEQIKSRERNLMADMDRRLRELERRGGAVAAGPADTPAAPAAAAPAAASSAAEQEEYDAAFNLLKDGYRERAIKGFREFIARHPDSPLAGNAQYWIGEANYVMRNFRQAIEEFSKVGKDYPANQKTPDALLKIGYSHYELGAWAKARAALNQVIARHPGTTAAKSAEARLAKMKKEGR